MKKTSEYTLPNGNILVSVNGYFGEDDFYMMYDIIKDVVSPEHITYGVDSMCVDGSFKKDGILVRMSSESAYDYCCFLYDPKAYDDEQTVRIRGWIEEIASRMNSLKSPVEKPEDEW